MSSVRSAEATGFHCAPLAVASRRGSPQMTALGSVTRLPARATAGWNWLTASAEASSQSGGGGGSWEENVRGYTMRRSGMRRMRPLLRRSKEWQDSGTIAGVDVGVADFFVGAAFASTSTSSALSSRPEGGCRDVGAAAIVVPSTSALAPTSQAKWSPREAAWCTTKSIGVGVPDRIVVTSLARTSTTMAAL